MAETKEQSKKLSGWEFTLKETDDGFVFQVKGDKERLRARREAVQAFKEFRRKAKAAGFGPGSFFRMAMFGLFGSPEEEEEED